MYGEAFFCAELKARRSLGGGGKVIRHSPVYIGLLLRDFFLLFIHDSDSRNSRILLRTSPSKYSLHAYSSLGQVRIRSSCSLKVTNLFNYLYATLLADLVSESHKVMSSRMTDQNMIPLTSCRTITTYSTLRTLLENRPTWA